MRTLLACLLVPCLARADESELARAAKGLKPGAWTKLTTVGYTRELLGKRDLLVYADKAAWCPTTRQVLFVGQDHLAPPPRLLVYREADNTWRASTPDWAKTLKWFHGYGNNAAGPPGVFFHHPSASRTVHRLDVSRDTWTTLPALPADSAVGHGTAIVWSPERKELLRILGGTVHAFSEEKKAWSVSRKLDAGPYHNVAVHSPGARAVFAGGGNGSRQLHRYDAAGKWSAISPAPANVGIGRSVLACDPVSGELLLLAQDDRFHAYDPARDTWRELPGPRPFAMKGSGHHVIAVPLSTHGVVMFFTSPARGLSVYLYRHRRPA